MLRKAFSEDKKKAARDGTGKGKYQRKFFRIWGRGFAEERVEKLLKLIYIFADSKIKAFIWGRTLLIPFVGDLHCANAPE